MVHHLTIFQLYQGKQFLAKKTH